MRKYHRDRLRHRHGDIGADESGDRAARRTKIALVDTAAVVMGAGMVMFTGLVVRTERVLLELVTHRVQVRVRGPLSFSLHARPIGRTQQTRGERAPNRQQHDEQ